MNAQGNRCYLSHCSTDFSLGLFSKCIYTYIMTSIRYILQRRGFSVSKVRQNYVRKHIFDDNFINKTQCLSSRLKNNTFMCLLDPLHRSKHEPCSILRACSGHTELCGSLGKRYCSNRIMFLLRVCISKLWASLPFLSLHSFFV